jgi:hypothetical protein
LLLLLLLCINTHRANITCYYSLRSLALGSLSLSLSPARRKETRKQETLEKKTQTLMNWERSWKLNASAHIEEKEQQKQQQQQQERAAARTILYSRALSTFVLYH